MFYFRISILIDGESEFVPRITEWYVLASNSYPFGRIEFLPAKDGGLQWTFPHQRLNVSLSPDLPWRNGCPCLTDWNRHVLRHESEFTHGPDRLAFLAWLLEKWLTRAATDTLVKNGDPFETPEFTSQSDNTVAYFEDEVSFSFWENLHISVSSGICDIGRISKLLVLRDFKATKNQRLKNFDDNDVVHPLLLDLEGTPKLSSAIAPPKVTYLGPSEFRPFAHFVSSPPPIDTAVWVLLSHIPVSRPWNPARSWGDLRRHLDWEDWVELHQLLRKVRPGYMLVGMPLPKTFGGNPCQIHWQGLKFPLLARASELRTLRPTKRNVLYSDMAGPLADDAEIEWINSENWSAKQMSRRLSEPDTAPFEDVLVIGCGAFGSTLAELLVRGGTKRIWLCDFDRLRGGNLVRGAYQIRDVAGSKSQMLSNRLTSISPHVHPVSLRGGFSHDKDNLSLETLKFVFDCSAENAVLDEIQVTDFASDTRIISLSANWKASRLLAIHSRMQHYNSSSAKALLKNMHGDLLPVEDIWPEGIGCYHPAFPADPHRVTLCVSMALERMRYWSAQDGQVVEYFDIEESRWSR